MAPPAARAYPRIRDAVELFIEDVQEYTERTYERLPTTTITESNTFRAREYEYTVEQPSKIVCGSNRFKRFYFSDLTESLIDDGLSFCSLSSDEARRNSIRKRIFELAKLTLDYAGTVAFGEDAFDAAYEDHLAPLYESTHIHRVIFPLSQMVLRPEDLSEEFRLTLEPLNEPVDNEYLVSLVGDLQLSQTSDFEMTGMQTYGTPGVIAEPDQTQKRLGWSTTLELKFEVTHRPTKHNSERVGLDFSWTGKEALSEAVEIAKQVVTTLRLWDPNSYAGLGPGYLLRDSWKQYRGICADIDRVKFPELRQRGMSSYRNSVELPEAEQDGFREHWQQVGPYCSLRNKEHNALYRCLTRFNRMYERSSFEDQIMDAFIGFETTLIRGDPGSVLPNRGAVLLHDRDDCNIDDLQSFFESVQSIRSRIVHNDASLSDELSIGRPSSSDLREYIRDVRWHLAQVVIAYSELLDEPSSSIQDINQKTLDSRINEMIDESQESVLCRLPRTLSGRYP